MARANATLIKEAAVRNGMVTMLEDGFQKAKLGVTTLEEVLRIIHE
jgi:type IV pilus assembly protein PilB